MEGAPGEANPYPAIMMKIPMIAMVRFGAKATTKTATTSGEQRRRKNIQSQIPPIIRIRVMERLSLLRK